MQTNWHSQIKLWEHQLEEQMNDVKERSRPAQVVTEPVSNSQTTREGDDSTAVPRIRVVKSTRRLIDEGEYENALCVNAFQHWHRQYKRWEAVIEFTFQDPVPAGPPIPIHVRLGDDPAGPVLKDHHWFVDLLLKLDRTGTFDVAALKGHYFNATVKTIKKPQHEIADRPAKYWYSRVSRISYDECSFFEIEAQEDEAAPR